MGVSGIAVFTALARCEWLALEVRALWIMLILLAAVLVFRFGFYDGSPSAKLGMYGLLPARADSVIVGALLAYVWVSGRIPYRYPTFLSWLALLAFAWVVSGVGLPADYFYTAGWKIVAACAALIIWGSLGSGETLYGRILMWPWLRSMGKVAYGLYLWHAFVFAAVRYSFGDESLLLRTILALGITAAVTAASWFWVEHPMLAYKTPAAKRAIATNGDSVAVHYQASNKGRSEKKALGRPAPVEITTGWQTPTVN